MHLSEKNIFPFSASGTCSVEYIILQLQLWGEKEESVTPVGHGNRLDNNGCNTQFSAIQY